MADDFITRSEFERYKNDMNARLDSINAVASNVDIALTRFSDKLDSMKEDLEKSQCKQGERINKLEMCSAHTDEKFEILKELKDKMDKLVTSDMLDLRLKSYESSFYEIKDKVKKMDEQANNRVWKVLSYIGTAIGGLIIAWLSLKLGIK